MDPKQLELIPDPPCLVCGRPAAFLCDGMIGWPAVLSSEDGDVTRVVIDSAVILQGTPAFTCDAELCEDCKVRGVQTIFCGKKGCEVEVEDLCPVCHEQGSGTFSSSSIVPMHETEADTIREDRHAQLMRMQMARTVR